MGVPAPPQTPEPAPAQPPPDSSGTTGWRAWMAPAALIAALGATLAAAAVISTIAGAAGADLDDPPASVTIASTFVQDAMFIAAALVFASIGSRARPGQFGLRRARVLRSIGWIALAAVVFFGFTTIWSSLLNVTDKDTLPQELGAGQSALALAAVTVLVTVVAPIAEELFFRGFFFGALRGRCGVLGAAVLTGIVFGLLHGLSSPAAFLVPLAVFGFVLCIVRWRTGSLYPGMALHALNNAIALGALEGWSVGVVLALIVGANAVVAVIAWPWGRRLAPSPGTV